jgi:zinc protease
MTAFISGDFETPEMKKLVNRYYGSVPEGPVTVLEEFSISPPYGSAIHVKRYPSDVTYIDIALPGPLCGEEGFYAFDFLSQYLDSDASPLNNAITGGDDPLATSVSVGLDIQAEFTMMEISLRTDKPGKIEKAVYKTLDILKEVAKREFSEADIRRVVIPNKVNEIKLEEKLHYYGIMKAPYLATCGYEFVENYVANLSKIDPDDISKTAKRYLSDPEYVASALAPSEGGE